MAPVDLSTSRNIILRTLASDDQAILAPRLTRTDLPSRAPLERPNAPIEAIVFPEHGLASTLAHGARDRRIEIAVIGREGMTGSVVALGADRTTNETFIQMPGCGLRITADAFRDALAESPTLRASVLVYVNALMVQTAQTALSNGRARLDERLSRWLLMCHDRADGDCLRLTHEFLALMLGVRRVGVTVALNRLVGEGLIATARGRIEILDRPALEALCGGVYGVPEAEYMRLMGFDGSFRSALSG